MAQDLVKTTYDDAVVIDGLNVSRWESPAVYRSLHDGGVTAINATSVVWENYREAMDNTKSWLRRFRTYEDVIVQARSAKDILQAKEDGKVGVVLGWQNASPIESDLDRLALFYELGVRIIQVTYNERNLLGNGCFERIDEGLSNFGIDAVKEMNELGILIDLSHVGDRTTLETVALSEQPVAFTHANARAFFDHPRNKTDEALDLLAQRGGVIGANAFPAHLSTGFESTLQDYVDSIDYLVERLNVDHVGIGTDFCQDQPKAFFDWIFSQQGTKPKERVVPYPDPHAHPVDLETPDKFSNIARELFDRGYEAEDVTKILGGNWLRLFQQVWKEK